MHQATDALYLACLPRGSLLTFDSYMPFRFFRLMRQPTANASADFYACRLTPTAYKDYRFYR